MNLMNICSVSTNWWDDNDRRTSIRMKVVLCFLSCYLDIGLDERQCVQFHLIFARVFEQVDEDNVRRVIDIRVSSFLHS